jgi:hypothetical protein
MLGPEGKELEAAVSQHSRDASLQSEVIVHRDLNVLLRPEIAFGGLDRRVAEQEFDLLQIPAVLPAQLMGWSAVFTQSIFGI